MRLADLDIFQDVPFLFWVKDESGRYVWANQAIRELANEDVVGKTDRELVWSDNSETLQAADQRVFATGKPSFLHESVDKSSRGNATLNVCKWLGELDGKRCCFGISFSID